MGGEGVTGRMRPRGETSKVGYWPSSPTTTTFPSHLYLSNWSVHLSVHDLELAVTGRNKGLTPVTNDNLRINISEGVGGGS